MDGLSSAPLATAIEWDIWTGGLCRVDTRIRPSLSDIEQAIRRLDQHRHSICTICLATGRHLVVGGGTGSYVVYVDNRNNTFEEARRRDPVDPGASLYLTIGGQEGDYPAETILDWGRTWAVARRLVVEGLLDDAVAWEHR
ncbi:Imm1 family immunity protein [Prosthecodimorpha staleyi]|uniref:Immunity protein Imm1 n=1 Tax=Prosthecodimorpha staleyi TaxID=2840188 RepID=A0A947GHY5_9HYPH|nr:Imm1 family immunity protein [Prosthecodimorpha staleyi]MBT9288334.1 hypothetical protein [Prosthecodimorpha staleyi]